MVFDGGLFSRRTTTSSGTLGAREDVSTNSQHTEITPLAHVDLKSLVSGGLLIKTIKAVTQLQLYE